jgi:kynurenine formamidase
MKLYLTKNTFIDTSKGFDISIPLEGNNQNPRAWYVDPPVIEPVRNENFIGSVQEGGAVNFRNIFFNPHGHGTHTECLGHITEEVHSINQNLKEAFFHAKLITLEPTCVVNGETIEEDLIVLPEQVKTLLNGEKVEALIIRTSPNPDSKKHLNYTGTNPAYLDVKVVEILNKAGVQHLLIDLPSVDRESDGGKLVFHHAFWGVPKNPQFHKTITELIYVPDNVPDGDYILNLQTAPFENDATPSRPVLFAIEQD